MLIHFIRIIAITVSILVFIFLTYFPGDYDASSVTLSSMAQLFGFSSLLFVPIGIGWLIYETIKQKKGSATVSNSSYRFAIAALTASVLVALITSLGAFVNHSLSLAVITILIYAFIFPRIVSRVKQIKNKNNKSFNPIPVYLVCIPIIVVLIRSLFIVPAIEFSRNYAIKQSEQYIQDIEAYHKRNGHYPVSLHSLWNDYRPIIRGIKQYHYEQNGNGYNVYFEQFSNELGVQEIVMYNKFGEHEMTSHDADLLQLSAEEQNRQRGYLSVHQLPQKNWKYFWFD